MLPPRSLPGQMLAVAAVSLALALAVNALHPGGVELGRNYFQKPQHEFQVISPEEFAAYSEFLYAPEGDVVFVDARRRSQYERGHVPGAYCVPRNDAQALEDLLPKARAAYTIVIYCQGGNCEDSIFTAEDLVYRNGIDPSLVWIYEGGWEEWVEKGGVQLAGADR
jgi:rhodanese-related sulfurtransferase